MPITIEMTRAAYQASKNIYDGQMNRNDALEYLATNYGMNRGSASAYIVNFKKMMDGEEYKRTLNKEATDYFLTQILSDYGTSKLSNAIEAANKHVEYYERLGKRNLKAIKKIISKHKDILQSVLESVPVYPDELDKPETLFEGIRKPAIVNSYERNPTARARCINNYGTQCVVCSFNFGEVYGEIGEGFIHVHHLTPLSDIKQGYKVDPIRDLCPVCPNCHAMLHKEKPPLTIDQLKERICTKREKI